MLRCVRKVPSHAAALASSLRPASVLRAAFSSEAAKPTTAPVQIFSTDFTEQTLEKIGLADEKLRQAYDAMPESYPAHAQPEGKALDKTEAFRKRLLYRSKQRGWLEVDLIMGSWAEKELPQLKDEELQAYERILNLETLDLFNMLMGHKEVPEELKGDKLLKSLLDYATSSPLGKADPKRYMEIKKFMSN